MMAMRIPNRVITMPVPNLLLSFDFMVYLLLRIVIFSGGLFLGFELNIRHGCKDFMLFRDKIVKIL